MKIKATSPLRVSLFGGSTDIESFYKVYGGLTISMAINLRQEVEISDEYVEHRLLDSDNKEFFKIFSQELKIDHLGITHKFDASSESGLGSSAALAVALVGAARKYHNLSMDRLEIATDAKNIEIEKCKLFGGFQDQIISAFGGMNLITFGKKVEVKPIDKAIAENIANHLLLFDTGLRRTNSKLQENLKELNEVRIFSLMSIKSYAIEAYKNLTDIDFLAELLQLSWYFKKNSNKVSTPEIDKIYDEALKVGAMAGKLNGSGGGGFMSFWAKPAIQGDIIRALEEFGCKHYDYSIDWQGLDVRRVL